MLRQPPRSTSSKPWCALQPPRRGGSRLSGLRGGGRSLSRLLARWGKRGAASPGAARTPRSAAAPGLRAAGLRGAAPTRLGPDRWGCHGSSSSNDRSSSRCPRRASELASWPADCAHPGGRRARGAGAHLNPRCAAQHGPRPPLTRLLSPETALAREHCAPLGGFPACGRAGRAGRAGGSSGTAAN